MKERVKGQNPFVSTHFLSASRKGVEEGDGDKGSLKVVQHCAKSIKTGTRHFISAFFFSYPLSFFLGSGLGFAIWILEVGCKWMGISTVGISMRFLGSWDSRVELFEGGLDSSRACLWDLRENRNFGFSM